MDNRGVNIRLESRGQPGGGDGVGLNTGENCSVAKTQTTHRKINQCRKVFAFEKFDSRPSYCRIRMEKKGWVSGLRIINVNLTKGSAAIKKLFVIISRVKYRVPLEYLNVEIKDLKKSYIPISALEPCVKVPETKLLDKEEL